ncbi:MAG: hypothetical protein H0T51_20690 [Pirellulales bacterium]|nr:hypothetical protein [Pirellulales bacterium]
MTRVFRAAFYSAAMMVGSIIAIAGIQSAVDAQQSPERSERNSDVGSAQPGNERVGDPAAGRDVFRFETFGNEGFWTDAMRLPQGVEQAKFTPLDAIKAGLHVDVDALEPAMKQAMSAELKTDLSPAKAPRLNDVKTTMALIKANAVIGIVPRGDKVGIACAICHTVTDKSVFDMPGGGSIGRRIDGPAATTIDMGGLLALAANSRAYYPNLQLELGGKTIGRAPKGIRADSTEEEVDAYLKNPKFYPRGTFDETQDGIGNPVQNTPLFRQDLAGPYGSNGLHEKFEGISNASYTTNLDPTNAATPEGLMLLTTLAGELGKELHANYVKILKETGVVGYPYVDASTGHKAGHRDTPVGRQVNLQKVLDMKAYTFMLSAPRPPQVDMSAAQRGGAFFKANCTQCHGADQSQPVPATIVSLGKIWPGYKPAVIAERKPPLSSIEDSPGGYDDKMVIIDASERGEIRGVPLPLLLDLSRKTAFLHDNSVAGLGELLTPRRGKMAPHPFYVSNDAERADVIAFLNGLRVDH